MSIKCKSCGKKFQPQVHYQKYCSRQCYELERRFRERLPFDTHKIWEWNRISTACLILLLVVGCAKTPQPLVTIPDPPASQKVWLAYDGEKLVWLPIIGGPSGAIDATSHFGEIELVDTAVAKYIRSPVTYAKQPAAGQLAVYGPAGASEQAVTASGMTAAVVGIENGILVPGELPAGANIERSAYYPAVNVHQTSAWPGHGWALPSKGYPTLASSTTPDGTRGGHLAFPAKADTSAVFRWRIDPAWDANLVHYFDLAWWSAAAAAAGADTVSITLDYACAKAGSGAGATDPPWTVIATKPITGGAANTLIVTRFNSPLSGCTPGNYVKLRIRRNGTEDTFNGPLNLDSVTLSWMQAMAP